MLCSRHACPMLGRGIAKAHRTGPEDAAFSVDGAKYSLFKVGDEHEAYRRRMSWLSWKCLSATFIWRC